MAKKLNFVFVVIFAGNILALINDTTLTWSSPILPKLHSNDSSTNPLGRAITEDEESWIGSLLNFGAVLGTLPFGFIADRIGRKPVLLFLAIPHILSYLTFAFAKNINLYYIGRFFGGIAMAGVYLILPMYMAEISEDSYRGVVLVSYSNFASLGDLLGYVLGPYLSIKAFNLVLAAFPIVFFILYAILAPESPHFLVGKNDEKAEKALRKLRSKTDVKKELEEIKREQDNHDKGNVWSTLKKNYVIKGGLICIGLTFFQTMSGFLAILAYTEIIFKSAGSDIPSDISAIIVGLVLFLATFTGTFLVDRKGRKFLLLCSATGVLIGDALLGTYFVLQDKGYENIDKLHWLPICSLVLAASTYCVGYGPLPMTVSSEILPSNVKFLLTTISSCIGWSLSFIINKYFNSLKDSIGEGEVFFLFSFFSLLGILFFLWIPETKGKSFQKIQNILAGHNT